MNYTNSPLADIVNLSEGYTKGRKYGNTEYKLDTITIHCFVGQVTAKRGAEVFKPKSKNASCNYVVGYDGSIALVVEEKNRSWCTGGDIKNNGLTGSLNDYRACTIEVASDNFKPYAVTNEAYEALIKLVADICRRNDIKALVWSGNKEDRINHKYGCNMTVHRDYATKSCPGDFLYGLMPEIARRVNAELKGTIINPKPIVGPTVNVEPEEVEEERLYKVQPGDCLSVIAKKLNTTVNKLVELNKQKYPSLAVNKNLIRVGWLLKY